MANATGRCLCGAKKNHLLVLDDISVVIKRLYNGKVQLIDRMHAFTHGIEFYRVRGHTDRL